MPLKDESGHKWKQLLADFDAKQGKDQDIAFKAILDAVEKDVFLLPKRCFDYYLTARDSLVTGLSERYLSNQDLIGVLGGLNAGMGSWERKEHKSLGSKIDRALFNLKKDLEYAWEEIKDFFTNEERAGGKFIQAMKAVFAAIKKFFVETIPNFTERAWSQVRENVLIPAQKNIDLAIDHVNEAISKGFTPKYVSSISGAVSEAYAENREIINLRAKAGIADEKLKRAIQDLAKEDREVIKDIMKKTRGSSSENEISDNLWTARAQREALRRAAYEGDKDALQEIVQQIKKSREADSTVSSLRQSRGPSRGVLGGDSSSSALF